MILNESEDGSKTFHFFATTLSMTHSKNYLMSAPALRASMKALVPDFAMVPRLFTRSALVIPIPLSSIVRELFA